MLNKDEPKEIGQSCNCRGECILAGIYRSKRVVYNASTENIQYIGSTSNELKIRYRNHNSSFINEDKKNETALSQLICNHPLN